MLSFYVAALAHGPAAAVQAAEVAGMRIDAKASVGGADLVLNGAGLRQRLRIDVYVIAIYLRERTGSAQSVIDADGPKRIALTFLRDVTAHALVEAMYEGLRDNASESEFANLKRSADQLSTVMLPLGVARSGDTVTLDYVPRAGAQVVFNGRVVGDPVPGPELYRALLRIWLGSAPVDGRLKRALLGCPVSLQVAAC